MSMRDLAPQTPQTANDGPCLDFDFIGYRGVSLHPYPATMPLPLARKLIRSYSQEGSFVFDPFAGSGTTLQAARLLSRDSIGSDLNPLACLIARVSSLSATEVPAGSLDKLRHEIWKSFADRNDGAFPEERWSDRIERWFPRFNIAELGRLAASIRDIKCDKNERDILLLAYSVTVRKASFARQGELKLWVRSDKRKTPQAGSVFFRELQSIESHFQHSQVALDLPNCCLPKVVHDDAINVAAQTSNVDLVVTSPPYGDAWTTVAYGNFTMLNRIWLGAIDRSYSESNPETEDSLLPGGHLRHGSLSSFDRINDISKEFGNVFRSIEKSNSTRADEFHRFIAHLIPVYNAVAAAVRTKGYFINVVGPRRVAGVRADTGMIISQLLADEGFEHQERFIRRVTGKRLPTKQGGGSGLNETINQETIDVLRKV